MSHYQQQLDFVPGKASAVTRVPLDVAACPECGHQLWAEAIEHTQDGKPTQGGLYIDCLADHGGKHRHWQCDWQPVMDAVGHWCEAQTA